MTIAIVYIINMTKTANFIVSLFVFILIIAFLLPAKKVDALSIDPDYFYQTACPILSTKDARTYSPGSRGDFVVALQQFLAVEGNYTYGMGPMSFAEFTGYYGPVTTKAVQDWQKAQGIVSSGSVYTTGFGNVGPKTRAAIRDKCAEALNRIEDRVVCQDSGLGDIVFDHQVQGNQHEVFGATYQPSPSYGAKLESVEVLESYPEKVRINLSSQGCSSNGGAVIQVEVLDVFKAEFNASKDAEIELWVNGRLHTKDVSKAARDAEDLIKNVEHPDYVTVGESSTWKLEVGDDWDDRSYFTIISDETKTQLHQPTRDGDYEAQLTFEKVGNQDVYILAQSRDGMDLEVHSVNVLNVALFPTQ